MLDSEGNIDLGGRRDLYGRLPQATMFLPYLVDIEVVSNVRSIGIIKKKCRRKTILTAFPISFSLK